MVLLSKQPIHADYCALAEEIKANRKALKI